MTRISIAKKIASVFRLAIALASVTVPSYMYTQQPIETWFDFNNRPDGAGNLFKTDYGYISFTGLSSLNSSKLGVLVRGFNQDGVLLFSKPYENDTLSWGRLQGQCVQELADNSYLAVFNVNSLQNQEYFFPKIFKFDNNGDTLWTKAYLEDSIGKFGSFAISESISDHYFLCGYVDQNIYDNTDPIKISILKITGNGELLWHKTLSNGQIPGVTSAITTENALYIGGIVFEGNDQAYGISKQFIRKFDLDGNSIWYKKIHVPPAGAEAPAVALIEREDGNIVYAGGRSLGVLPGTGEQNNSYTAPCAGVINATSGNVIFENTYNNNARYQQFYNLKRLSSGGYIGVGTHRFVSDGELAGNPIGFMVKLDEDLNQIWYRYYVPSVWEGFGRWNNLTDVVENDNGTFTAIGLIYTYTGDGPQGPGEGGFIQDTYLITVDEEGCIIPGCYLGFTEVDELEEFSVYPNPANNQINLKWNKIENTDVVVYNSTGQVVLKKAVNQQNQLVLDISSLPLGVYTIRCVIDERIFSKVFVKE